MRLVAWKVRAGVARHISDKMLELEEAKEYIVSGIFDGITRNGKALAVVLRFAKK